MSDGATGSHSNLSSNDKPISFVSDDWTTSVQQQWKDSAASGTFTYPPRNSLAVCERVQMDKFAKQVPVILSTPIKDKEAM